MILNWCLSSRHPFVVRQGAVEAIFPRTAPIAKGAITSELFAAAGGERVDLLAIPIHELRPYQGCVVIAGSGLATEASAVAALENLCLTAFRLLMNAGRIDVSRPGDLSERERHVLQLTAIGKTAAEIADLLTISQRTVHAHLQNAADKMNASNKTHTVVEALRHGQIDL